MQTNKKTEALGIVGCTEAGDLRVIAAPQNRHFGGKTMCLLGDSVNVPTLFFFLICEMPLNNPNHAAFLLRKLDKQLGQGTLFAVDLFVRQRCRPSLVSNGSCGAFVLRLNSLCGWLTGWFCIAQPVKALRRKKKNHAASLSVWTTEGLFSEEASRELWDPVYWNPVCEPPNASKIERKYTTVH